MKVCIAEKPSVARDIARMLGATTKMDGYYEGNDYQVTWVFGHLCTLKEPHDYDPMWKQWMMETLPIIPSTFGIKLKNDKGVSKQFNLIKRLIDNAEYVAVSIASFWEIAIKQSIGKIQLCMTIPELESMCFARDIQLLPIQSVVLEQIKMLPQIHGDPFDRIIIAQAQAGKMTIITRDRMIPQYPVTTVW